MDRRRWVQWLFEARKRYGLVILNYTVTSNHIHLLVVDDKDRDVIPNSIKLIAGRTGQEFNIRKNRKGAFWEDLYRATAIENGEHLLRCLMYIDLNMVRAGVVKHPSEWPFGGYNEIQEPKRKNVLIWYDRLRELAGIETYDLMQAAHKKWVESYLTGGIKRREECWTRSIAVGCDGFVRKVKSIMGVSAIGKNFVPAGDSYQLREPQVSYNADSGL